MSLPRRFGGWDVPTVEKLAMVVDPTVEWHAETGDYGWRMTLCGAVIVAGEQIRWAFHADLSRDAETRRQIEASPNFDSWLEGWATRKAHAIVKKLCEVTPEDVSAAKAANGRLS